MGVVLDTRLMGFPMPQLSSNPCHMATGQAEMHPKEQIIAMKEHLENLNNNANRNL